MLTHSDSCDRNCLQHFPCPAQQDLRNMCVKISDERDGYFDSPTPPTYALHCAECFGRLDAEQTYQPVINPVTERMGLVHGSCFDANDDILEIIAL